MLTNAAWLGRVPLVRRPSLGAGAVEVSDDTFNQILLAPQAVVDFWSSTCPPCMEFKPIFEDVAADPSITALLGTVNADESPTAVASYGVDSLPTILFLKNGSEVDRVTGKMERADLVAKIASVFGTAQPAQTAQAPDQVMPQTPTQAQGPQSRAVQQASAPKAATGPGAQAAPGFPWIWVAGGGVVVAALGFLAFKD